MPDAALSISAQWNNLDEAFADLEQECTDVVRGLTVFLWNSILTKTPQYFGGMAASWTYTYSASNAKDRSNSVKREAGWREGSMFGPPDLKYRGHPVAIAIANAASAGKDSEFKLGRTVYLTNGVNHGEGPYSVTVENYDAGSLRLYNRPGRPVSRSLDAIQSKFGDDISKRYAQQLRAMKIGGGSAASDS